VSSQPEHPAAVPFSLAIRVYIEDTDAGGRVYYVNHLKYMERARSEWLRRIGFEQQTLRAQNLLFVVHSLELRYHRPARLDQLLRVTAELLETGRASLLFAQQVLDAASGACLASGQVRIAAVAADSGRPLPLPEPLRHALVSPPSLSP